MSEVSQLSKGGKKGYVLSSTSFCSVQALDKLDHALPHEVTYSTESTDSMARVIQKHLYRYTQKQWVIWAHMALAR